MTEKVLTVRELQERLRLGRSITYELVRTGRIRSIRVGTVYRIPESAVADFLAGREPE